MFLRRKPVRATASDEDLVLLLRQGDQAALGDLWDRYAHLLYGVGLKYLKDPEASKDQVVDLFGTLPVLVQKHAVAQFRSWVHAVMRNRCLQVLRRQRPGATLDAVMLTDDDIAGETLLREASLQQLEQAIEQLNGAQRTCIRLFHLEENSYQQVADQTSFTIEQVRSHLQNGRRNLRLILLRHADRNA
jgi:RNA polymerase sigma-70 factor (ECF subfamily)